VVLQNNPDLLQELIRRGIRIFNQSTYDGATALHRAAEVNSLECAQILIEQNADIDATNFRGETALHVAAENDSQEVA
jgi:ankyrin repeat protein